MRRSSGRRVQLILMISVVLLVVILLLVRFKLAPMIETLAVTQVENKASDIISAAIDEQVTNGNIDYDKMVNLEKDDNGNVKALKTNMAEVNRLRKEVMDMVNQRVMDMDIYDIGIPVGNVFLPSVLSGRGPYIPVEIVSVNNGNISMSSSFTDAGINQTLHRIIMHITIDIAVLVPSGTKQASVTLDLVVAETVIVGTVPNSVLTVGK